MNEVVQSVKMDWKNLDKHSNSSVLDYVVLGMDGELLYQTREGLSETVSEAVFHRDTILTLEENGNIFGKIMIWKRLFFGKRERFLFFWLWESCCSVVFALELCFIFITPE